MNNQGKIKFIREKCIAASRDIVYVWYLCLLSRDLQLRAMKKSQTQRLYKLLGQTSNSLLLPYDLCR